MTAQSAAGAPQRYGSAGITDDPASLIRNGMVHANAYDDERIFELEMERIFHRCWMFIGHESEIPNKGDFRRRTIGRQPVIFVRGKDDAVRVLINRCRHRGAMVCELEEGRADRFRCWYHGWVFDNAGKLVDVPGPEAYGPEFDRNDYGLAAAPRLDHYRGFYFASFAPEGISLAEHLGPTTEMFDRVVDLSPTGRIAVDSGAHKTTFKGNWKLVGMDGYHPTVLHASVIENARRRHGNAPDPWDDASDNVTRHLGHGHTMLDLTAFQLDNVGSRKEGLRRLPGGEDYISAMTEAYGEDRANLLIAVAGDPHMGFFPNLQLIGSQIRIIVPIAADETQVIMMPVRLLDVPEPMNVGRLRAHEMFYGPAGAGSPDDAEIFERVQHGLKGRVAPWINLQRGMHRETQDVDGTTIAKISDELPQRAQFAAWLEYMAEGAAA
jgi:nitrite reductase/ring-hydroxylating ferredoxin subunit